MIETDWPDLVALDADGCLTGKTMDFFHRERLEMCTMSAPSEISHNVWLGPTPDPTLTSENGAPVGLGDPRDFDVLVEASDLAQVPDAEAFALLEDLCDCRERGQLAENGIPQLEFPGSGAIMAPTWSQSEVDGLLATCEWIYKQAHPAAPHSKRRDSKLSLTPSDTDADGDGDGDAAMTGTADTDVAAAGGRKILIHCTDGYTESSLLALAYYMYAEHVPVHTAWLQLHLAKRRNFFAYGSDVALLRAVQPRLLQSSPKHTGELRDLSPAAPGWLEKMDGSLPSRILDYMYLGNLGHANNPELLRELGIGQILSVGEPVSWDREAEGWPEENLMLVDRVQDNGVDPLTGEFEKCLEFIGKHLPPAPPPPIPALPTPIQARVLPGRCVRMLT